MKRKTMRESEQGTDIHRLVEVNWVGRKDKGIHFPPKLRGKGENREWDLPIGYFSFSFLLTSQILERKIYFVYFPFPLLSPPPFPFFFSSPPLVSPKGLEKH